MRHIPNIITLMNLFFGCLSIVTTLTAYPYFKVGDHENQYLQISGMYDLYWGGIFIFMAAVMDLFDGLAARLLKVESQTGEFLDSLADIVSFGVAPAMILYQLLWRAYVTEPDAMQTPVAALIPAFLIVLFGALRLARFNARKSTDQFPAHYFTGLPIPATGIIIACFPMMLFFEYSFLGSFLEKRGVLYAVIAIFSYLMVSNIRFLKWNSGLGSLSKGWPIILSALVTIGSFFFFPYSALFLGLITYLILSIVYPYSRLDTPAEEQQ